MIDKEGRLFGKINIFDLAVILIVLAVAVRVAYVKLNVQQITAPPQDAVRLELRADVYNPLLETLAVGQKVSDKRTGVILGEIVELSFAPVPVPLAGANGEVIMADAPRHTEVRMILQSKAVISENAYTVGALAVRVGERFTLMGPQFSFDATLTAMARE